MKNVYALKFLQDHTLYICIHRQMRRYLHIYIKEWVWIGDILCLTKDEALHTRVAKND